ncbi:hypothetical protein VNI00_019281 [Paramarasmius palmivorus]|uniref:Uncharacterized protein n=1 Tax=Paramarasmius palmivorus TaxID=297713 RepID=A0AAW0AP11_9AGAR
MEELPPKSLDKEAEDDAMAGDEDEPPVGSTQANEQPCGKYHIVLEERLPFNEDLFHQDALPILDSQRATSSAATSAGDEIREGDAAHSLTNNALPFTNAEIQPASSSKRKRRSGNPGNYQGEQLDMLEEAYPEYEKLPRRSKESGDWLRAFAAKFLAKFPVDKYPPPPAKQMEPVPEVDMDSLTRDQKKTHRRRVLAVQINESPEERQGQALKRYFYWRASNLRGKEGESVEKFLKSVVKEEKRPRKQQVKNFLMSHPDYKDKVAGQSKETGRLDRLPNRREAAATVWNSLDDEKRQHVLDGIQTNLESALKSYEDAKEGRTGEGVQNSRTRRSVGRIIQPIIDTLHRQTGLSIVVLVGEDMDGNDLFDSATLSASPPGTPKITQFNTDKFRPFIEFFYRWLRFIRQDQVSKGLIKDDCNSGTAPGDSNENTSAAADAQKSTSEEPPNILPRVPSPRKLVSKKGKGKRKQCIDEDDLTDGSESLGSEELVGGDDDAYGNESGSDSDSEEEPVERARQPTPQYPEGSYMAQQTENICRNKQLLASLGLDRDIFEKPLKAGPAKKPKVPRHVRSSTLVPRRSSRLSKESTSEGADNGSNVEISAESGSSPARRRILDECERFIKDDSTVTTATLTDLVVSLTPERSKARTVWVAYVSRLTDMWYQRQEDPLGDNPWPSPPEEDPEAMDEAMTPIEDGRVPSIMADPAEPRTPTPDPTEAHMLHPAVPNDAVVSLSTSNLADADTPLPAILSDTESLSTSAHRHSTASPRPHEGPAVQDEQEVIDSSSSRCEDVIRVYASISIPVGYGYEPGDHDSPTIQWFVDYLLASPAKYSGPARPQIWKSLVFRWADLQELWEKVPGYPDKKAPKLTRPGCIEQWNKGGRSRSRNWGAPGLAKLELLRVQWWTWWASAFPEQALNHNGFIIPDESADLSEMHLRGDHGIVLFLVVLRWWHDAGGHEDALGMWEEGVRSVYWVIDRLVNEL